ncbi:hypothetical protein LCGC14_0273170 [marine sediment metagenome]|uniref:Uncharacterized protein n=2 Tax=root TaxID=1 RepID=A0A9C9THN1_9HYPH|nr:hypothetical protein [Aurantimonas coralicida]
MRALFVVAEGYKGENSGCELETHNGVATHTQDNQGPLVRLQIGYRDAGSLMRWLWMVFPDAEANVIGCRCACGKLATVNLHLLGDKPSGHWCDDCVPEDKREEFEENKARGAHPHEKRATEEAVRYYLRSAYGYTVEEVADAIREHPYTIASAAGKGMSVEECAVDINRRRTRPSPRVQLEEAAAEKAAE